MLLYAILYKIVKQILQLIKITSCI